MPAQTRDSEAAFLGADGLATLLAAGLLAGATGGLSLLPAAWQVARVAWSAPSAPCRAATPRRAVVLGLCLPADGRPCAAFRARLDRARALAAHDPSLIIVVLGGAPTPGAAIEAEAGRRYLIAAGVAAARIAIEARSRHTLENLSNFRAHFATTAGSSDLLVTSRFHLARAGLMARGLGLELVPCAAEDHLRPTPRLLARLAVEAFLLHWYVVGRGIARLARHRGMLARIH